MSYMQARKNAQKAVPDTCPAVERAFTDAFHESTEQVADILRKTLQTAEETIKTKTSEFRDALNEAHERILELELDVRELEQRLKQYE